MESGFVILAAVLIAAAAAMLVAVKMLVWLLKKLVEEARGCDLKLTAERK